MLKTMLPALIAVLGLAMVSEANAAVRVVAGPRGVAVGVGTRPGYPSGGHRHVGTRPGYPAGPRHVGVGYPGGHRHVGVGYPGGPRVGINPYYARHGVRYGSSYYYAGRNHNHWQHRIWVSTMSRYHYYDPYLSTYYYYCPERLGYYPVP